MDLDYQIGCFTVVDVVLDGLEEVDLLVVVRVFADLEACFVFDLDFLQLDDLVVVVLYLDRLGLVVILS